MPSEPTFIGDLGHVLVAGATGSKPRYGGKSTTANAWAASTVHRGDFDAAIFFNPKHDDGIIGRTVHSIAEVARALRSGESAIDLRPSSTTGSEEHEKLREFVARLEDTRLLVIHDECADYPDSLRWFLKRGGNESSCKSLALTQNPYEVPATIRGNLHTLIWVGPANGALKTFSQRSDWPDEIYSIVSERHTEPYRWTAFDGNSAADAETFAPVSEVFVA